MTLSFVFWLIMLIWAVFGIITRVKAPPSPANTLKASAGEAVLFILVALLGWQTFGPPIK